MDYTHPGDLPVHEQLRRAIEEAEKRLARRGHNTEIQPREAPDMEKKIPPNVVVERTGALIFGDYATVTIQISDEQAPEISSTMSELEVARLVADVAKSRGETPDQVRRSLAKAMQVEAFALIPPDRWGEVRALLRQWREPLKQTAASQH